MNYRAFGLRIASDVPLSALPEDNESDGEADVFIRVTTVSENGLTLPAATKFNSQTAPNEVWFDVPDIGRFYITGGTNIDVEPAKGADEQSVRLYVLGTCMGAVMHQRNRLVLHGNAIRIHDGCVVFAGLSGKGKSTLAAAFHKRGYALLSDDLAVLDENYNIQPAYPHIKIWQNTANMLGIDTSGLKKIRMQFEKYAYPLTAQSFCNRPLPLRAVYILSTHNKESVEITPIQGADKFLPLRNQTYRRSHLEGLGLSSQHLKICAGLANVISVTRVVRPREGCDLKTLVDMVEADIHSKAFAA